MKKWVWTLGLAAVGGAIVACTSEVKNVAGSSMETENSIAVKVFLANGKPAARMKVLVRPETYVVGNSTAIVDSTLNRDFNFETDSAGTVRLETLDFGSYVVEARSDSLNLKGASTLSYGEQDSSVAVSVNVSAPGSISGRVTIPDGLSSVMVGIQGLDYLVQTDSLGRFEFSSLPAGDFDVVAFLHIDSSFTNEYGAIEHAERNMTFGVVPATVTSGVSEKCEQIGDTLRHFMFEDFENGVGNWVVGASEYASGKLDVVEDRGGMVAHFVCQNDSNYNWVLFGRDLGGYVDMSRLDSIVFWVRSSKDSTHISFSFDLNQEDRSQVNMDADDEDSTETMNGGKAWVHFDVSQEWQRFVVTPDVLLEVDSNNIGGNIGWDAIKTRVNKLSLFGGSGGEFWFDNIEVFGYTRFVTRKEE